MKIIPQEARKANKVVWDACNISTPHDFIIHLKKDLDDVSVKRILSKDG